MFKPHQQIAGRCPAPGSTEPASAARRAVARAKHAQYPEQQRFIEKEQRAQRALCRRAYARAKPAAKMRMQRKDILPAANRRMIQAAAILSPVTRAAQPPKELVAGAACRGTEPYAFRYSPGGTR